MLLKSLVNSGQLPPCSDVSLPVRLPVTTESPRWKCGGTPVTLSYGAWSQTLALQLES